MNDVSRCPTVAIGASAGGVKALQDLFAALPPDLGAAYVVVVHLDPDHPSELVQILSRRTIMPVAEVEEATPLVADRVYVIAPNRRLVISDNVIATRPFDEPRGQRAPIDLFFRSLADQHGDGFAIVLSGSGSDGSIGIRAMKEAGGVILVQDPNEAEYGSMPRSAIATGCADIVQPIAELARSLVDLVQHRLRLNEQQEPEGAESVIPRILAHLRTRTGHDFINYKRATILRRLMRRMQLSRLERMEDYLTLLRENADETQALFGDLLISVTTFFRDPEAFKTLADQVIPSLFARQDDDRPLRVWVAGCATGEEVYSIAILLLEEAARRDVRPEIQIFATDIDAAALATAREGRYPSAIETDVSEERLRRFFTHEGDTYHVRKDVRDLVVFASHSLLRDPPFSRVDLVSCRNLLIYLEREVQKQVLTMLRYALNPGGFLFLGSAETPDAGPGLFHVVERKARIYEAVEISPERRAAPALVSPSAAPLLVAVERRLPQRASAAGARHQKVLEELAAPSVLVGAGGQVLNLSETAGRYLLHPEGPLSSDITQLVRPELRLDVGRGIHLAFEAAEPSLSLPIAVQFNGTARRVMVQVRPLRRGGAVTEAVILFVEGGPIDVEPDLKVLAEEGALPDTLVAKLQDELHLAREQLRVSRQEYESANEELRAANEELQSINEEYRSTSEELETSKEELQSLNEELQTVNTELKLKVESVSQANADLQNLMAATEGGTLFLDTELRINRFTPLVAKHFNIAPGDEGRPITDFTHKLKYEGLADDTRTVLQTLTPIERRVENGDGSWNLVRIRPYRTEDNRIDGVVITFIDITQLRRTETALRDSEASLRAIVDTAADSIITIDEQGIIQAVNPATEKMFGYAASELMGQNVKILMPPEIADVHDGYLGAYARGGPAKIIGIGREVEGRRKDGSLFPIDLSIAEWRDDKRYFTGTLRDVTNRKKIEEELAHGAAMARRIAALTKRESDILGLIVAGHANKEIAARLGISQRTVESHRAALMKKLGARSLSELVRMEMEARR